MAGLLGKALAGAAAGGQEVVKVGMQDYLMRERDALESKRQERLMSFQASENVASRALTQQQIAETGRHNIVTEAEQQTQTKETGRHNKASERLQSEAFKNSGLSVQQTDQGMVIINARNPEQPAVVLKGPDGKPLQSLKDNSAVFTSLASMAKTAMDTGDMERAKQYLDAGAQLIQGRLGNQQQPQQQGGRPPLSVFGGAKPAPSAAAPSGAVAQPTQGTSERMVAGMSEAALQQAAEKNDDIGRAARVRLAGIERERAEASDAAAQFPYPR